MITKQNRWRSWGMFLALVLLMIVGGCGTLKPLEPLGQTFPVDVYRVVSGQKIKAQFPEGRNYFVRLQGVNTPDFRQEPWGEAAKIALENLIHQAQTSDQPLVLELDRPEPDQYGNYWGYLWHGSTLVNRMVVAQGHGLAALDSLPVAYQNAFERSQAYARIMGYGIWDPAQPLSLTPQEFRDQLPPVEP